MYSIESSFYRFLKVREGGRELLHERYRVSKKTGIIDVLLKF